MHITCNIWDRKDARHPGLIERMYTVTIHRPGGATDFYTTPSQYRRIYAWLLRRGAVNNPYNLPDYDVLVYKTELKPTMRWTPPAPATNTEAAQQNAAEMEQAEQPALVTDIDTGAHAADFYWNANDRAAYRLSKGDTTATLLDDVQTLPIFSGTCPRVADPGRFDPPQISTDRQPSLF